MFLLIRFTMFSMWHAMEFKYWLCITVLWKKKQEKNLQAYKVITVDFTFYVYRM